MPRPPKPRWIAWEPTATVFKPAGVPARGLRWLTLALDEFEALRLVDGEGLDQEQAAARMGVSRPTVTRLLARARAKAAQMICEGFALLIEGGPVMPAPPMAAPFGPGRRGWRGGRGGGGRGRGWGRGGRGGPGRGGPLQNGP